MTVYTVKGGDTIYGIARRYGISPNRIITYNELKNPVKLVIGQDI